MGWLWIAVAAVVALYLWQRQRHALTREQAAELLGKGGRILDVRSAAEYAGGHVEGAVNAPLDQLEARVGKAVPTKDTPVLLYCLSGTRSAGARRTLERRGYTCVHNVGSLSRARRVLSREAASSQEPIH